MDEDQAARRHPVLGTEWDWLACDASGRVALLSTGGGGPVPQSVLRSVDQMNSAVEAARQLPQAGEASEVRRESGDWSDWVAAATQGLYAYDWGPWTGDGPYTLVAAPSCPVDVEELPPLVADAARLYRFPLQFADAAELHLPDDA